MRVVLEMTRNVLAVENLRRNPIGVQRKIGRWDEASGAPAAILRMIALVSSLSRRTKHYTPSSCRKRDVLDLNGRKR